MTIKEVNNVLKKVGIPVAYQTFKAKTNPPFIAFTCYTRTLCADGKVTVKVHSVSVELYSQIYDSNEQLKLEKVLADSGIVWTDCTCLYIESERLYEIIYNFETEEKI